MKTFPCDTDVPAKTTATGWGLFLEDETAQFLTLKLQETRVSFYERFYSSVFRERGEGREKERERNMDWPLDV